LNNPSGLLLHNKDINELFWVQNVLEQIFKKDPSMVVHRPARKGKSCCSRKPQEPGASNDSLLTRNQGIKTETCSFEDKWVAVRKYADRESYCSKVDWHHPSDPHSSGFSGWNSMLVLPMDLHSCLPSTPAQRTGMVQDYTPQSDLQVFGASGGTKVDIETEKVSILPIPQ
jgi:hypothetical protein